MSFAWTLRLIGKIKSIYFSSRPHLAFISGVRDDVAQVSSTSVSGSNSMPPHFAHVPSGLLMSGSTGRSSSMANLGSPHFLQYQTGNGMPKYLCLEMLQSHFRPLTQFSYLTIMNSGCHFTCLPSSMNFPLRSRYLMYHCFLTMSSISVLQRSCTLTLCSMSSSLVT